MHTRWSWQVQATGGLPALPTEASPGQGCVCAARGHCFTTPSRTTAPPTPRAGALKAPATPNSPNPRPGIAGSSSSRSRVTTSQAGGEAAVGSRASPTRLGWGAWQSHPEPAGTHFRLHLSQLDSLLRPSPPLPGAPASRNWPSSAPVPGGSSGGAWSGAREGGGGARPRAPGPRSRCGQAPAPPRGPGYSPRRCSSAT